MITFFVCISDGDTEFKRLFSRESLPRIGEMVRVGGSFVQVTCVYHDLEEDTPPMIDLDIEGIDYERALEVGEWEKVS